ncbi:MAG: class I SAM-dependent methyltransferase [Candidatus Binataceae bacterium]|nr:class I SAM-dependent methyltransferase [Candidatus Binataceae bacterium]
MESDPFAALLQADQGSRGKLYETAYNHPGRKALPDDILPDASRLPKIHARRARRLSLFKQVMGTPAGPVLEIGCGTGDLTVLMAQNASKVVAIDLSSQQLKLARTRAALDPAIAGRIEFLRMNAIRLELLDETFEFAASTSMIEHLHPEDVDIHLKEVCRVLKPGGRYLVWCPNRLGHHQDRPFHLCMMSYQDLKVRMMAAGFTSFQSPLLQGLPLVSTSFKTRMESMLSALHITILWSHLGVRNVMIVARK